MAAWGGYASEPRFGLEADAPCEQVRGLGERLADARDEMRPPSGDEGAASLIQLGLFWWSSRSDGAWP